VLDIAFDTRVAEIAFVGWEDGNFLAMVYLPEEGRPWRFRWRFRYSSGEETWYTVDGHESAEDACRIMRVVAEMTAVRFHARGDLLRVYGTGEDAFRMMAEFPWCQLRLLGDETGQTEAQCRAMLSNGRLGN